MYDVCIVGGGASGMSAAITIAMNSPRLKIVVLEKKNEICNKVKAAGNGKCNISNIATTTFGDTVKFFRKIGIEIKSDERGWAYPVSERGEDVLYAFKRSCSSYGVDVKTGFNVTKIEKENNHFIIFGKVLVEDQKYLEEKQIKAKKIIIASGGKSYPEFGTIGDSYKFVKSFGHTVEKLRPSLTPIECKNKEYSSCNGVRAKGEVTLTLKGIEQISEIGEVQFTKYGISGIVIYNLSRHIIIDEETKFTDYTISINFINRYKIQEILMIMDIRKNIKDLETKDIMMSVVNRKISDVVLRPWVEKKKLAKDLTKEDLFEIAVAFMNVELKVTGLKGWKDAQVTSGGVNFSEFNYETMESIKCKGLYITGEVIDYDGPCGGYNLENAWNTGRKAGVAVCTELEKSL